MLNPARLSLVLLTVLTGCKGPTALPAGEGLLGDHPLNPFPVGVLHMADGHIALQADDFDLPVGETPLRTERLTWREGFSTAQTSVVLLDSLDASALPSIDPPTPGEGAVRLLDRTTGTWLPVLAEIDIHPEATPNTLMVRPLVAMTAGHEVAVVLTTALTPRVERFSALFDGRAPPELAPHVEHFEALMADVTSAGLDADEVALAWDFPVADGTRPMRSAWSQVEVPTAWTMQPPRDVDEGDGVAPYTYKATIGTVSAVDFLVDDLGLQLEPDGSVTPTGSVEVDVYVHLPLSVADAPAGSVPILLFGHGIFGAPPLYLDTPDDDSALQELADDLGVVVVGTRWRGLSRPDLAGALVAGGDFARIHEVTDRLVQGQANTDALLRLLQEPAFLAEPAFAGRSGQSLPDPAHIGYYGISLGAIEGAVLLANNPPIEHAVLHVGGSVWSTMLERSSNWPTFEFLLEGAVPDALTRQRLYAVSQLWWDPVDPVAYSADLVDRPFLLQEALGDQQVPNLSTDIFSRSVGLVQLLPGEPVWGVETVTGTVGDEAVLVQLEPERGRPPAGNRPAADSGAHEAPRHYPGVAAMTRQWLTTGTVSPGCGTVMMCAESNPGTP